MTMAARKTYEDIVEKLHDLSETQLLAIHTIVVGLVENDDRGKVVPDSIKKLTEIEELEDNWNGNGAASFPKELTMKVRYILEHIAVEPEVFPTACNTIQLEFDRADGAHMEIEISESMDADLFSVSADNKETCESIACEVSEINKVVKEFYGEV